MGEQKWTARSEFSDLPIPSVARRMHEEREVEEGVEAIFDELRHAVLRGLSRLMIFGVIPLVAFIVVQQVNQNGQVWFWSSLILLTIVMTAGATLKKLSLRTRGQIVTYSMTTVALLGVILHGPLLAIGFAFVASVLLATLFVGSRHTFAVATLLSLGMSAFAFFSWRGFGFFHPEVDPPLAQWVRVATWSFLGLYFFAFVFLRVQSGLASSLGQQIRLRLREQRFVEEREKMVRSAGSVQRLESLGRLAGGIAHDFNNSLLVIQCGLGALDNQLPAKERQEIMREVSEGVNRAAGTARQLLSFAKRNAEEIGVCDPREVVLRLLKEASRLLPANITMQAKIADGASVPVVGLSELAVEQILLTLIGNAREALGEEAGQVTIELGESCETNGCLLRVHDSGPGIPAEIRDQVWEPFFTTKGEEHLGLGLSTLWATVRRHGGSVELSSGTRTGTTVAMDFPPASLERPHPKKRLPETGAPFPAPRTVLVLEDEAPIRMALRRVLKHSGLVVVEAATVSDAREALEQRQFALLISDGVLPDGGVGKFIRDFREKQRAPVILCSGYVEEDLALEGISKGECSFLPKPFAPDDLIELVETLLNQETSPGESSSQVQN